MNQRLSGTAAAKRLTGILSVFSVVVGMAWPVAAEIVDAPKCRSAEPELYSDATLMFGGLSQVQEVLPGTPCFDVDGVDGADMCCWGGSNAACAYTLRWHPYEADYVPPEDPNDPNNPPPPFTFGIYPSLKIGRLINGVFWPTECRSSIESCWGETCDEDFYYAKPNLPREFQLYAVSDCDGFPLEDPLSQTKPFYHNPLRERLVAEFTVKYPEPQGAITANHALCVRSDQEGIESCTVDLTWESKHIGGGLNPKVVVYVKDNSEDPWDTAPWYCGPANELHADEPSFHITQDAGITFELWSVPTTDCSTGLDYSSTAGVSPPLSPPELLDSVEVTSVAPLTPVCPVDDQPMAEAEVGVITNGLQHSCNAWCKSNGRDPDQSCRNHCYGEVAAKLEAAGVGYHRISIRWDLIYAGEVEKPAEGDWLDFDGLLGAFSNAGIEAWLTFDNSPKWASSWPFGGQMPCWDPGTAFQFYPPKNEEMEAWGNFVYEVIDRYHTGGYPLGSPPKNFEVWQEPNNPGLFAIDPLSCKSSDPCSCNSDQTHRYNAWEGLQDKARESVQRARTTGIEDLKLWSANLAYTALTVVADFEEPWVNRQIDTFGTATQIADGFNMHTFQRDYPNKADTDPKTSTLDTTYHMVKHTRARLDSIEPPVEAPLAITAATWHSHEKYDPWSFEDEIPNGADRGDFLKKTFACMANAGASHILWFNAVDFTWGCGEDPENPTGPCIPVVDYDTTNGEDIRMGLGLLDENLGETELWLAFREISEYQAGL